MDVLAGVTYIETISRHGWQTQIYPEAGVALRCAFRRTNKYRRGTACCALFRTPDMDVLTGVTYARIVSRHGWQTQIYPEAGVAQLVEQLIRKLPGKPQVIDFINFLTTLPAAKSSIKHI